ncbi:MAG: hypothetical protein ACRD1H_04210, partial [Vicinamibacterales bacterium]
RTLVIWPILFAVALWFGRIPRAPRWALLTFCGSHIAAMVVGAPWTYGYKTILPFHLALLVGSAFLLPRWGVEWWRERVDVPRRLSPARPTVSVVLPTYNEKDSIREVIQDFFATNLVNEVLVINNNAAGARPNRLRAPGLARSSRVGRATARPSAADSWRREGISSWCVSRTGLFSPATSQS